MGFCRKCGHELADDVLFCNKCGEKTDLGLEQVPEMSKEDSIQLADTLREKYASAEKLSYEISENEKIIKSLWLSSTGVIPHSGFSGSG